jgi:hypothetical protein
MCPERTLFEVAPRDGEEEVSTSNTLDCPGYVNRPIEFQSLFGPVSNRTGPPDPPENESAGARAGAAFPHVDRLAAKLAAAIERDLLSPKPARNASGATAIAAGPLPGAPAPREARR